MRTFRITLCCLAACTAAARAADDFLDRVDDALAVSAWNDDLRARLSGSLDLEGYNFPQPAPALIDAPGHNLFNPRLVLFLDAQLGSHLYFFAQSRVDRGFDPAANPLQMRLDEYAIRFTPRDDARINLQIGKFATAVGNWVPRHGSWDNPFITAPLPYENLTGIWDAEAAPSGATLLEWAHVRPGLPARFVAMEKYLRIPVIWGPSYASGIALSGALDKFRYALEMKNADLSSRPDSWNDTGDAWRHPTFSGRLGYGPDERWNFGLSASVGPYLRPEAAPSVAPGSGFGDYREELLGQDISFAWHHLQVWTELYETRFENPVIGHADTFSYYTEAKYKFTPQFFGAVRWNQQLFGTIPVGTERVAWGHDVWRIDVAPGYRFTPHTQLKLQYSLQHDDLGPRVYTQTLASQFVLRF
jgi:hypothetical protein